MPLTPLRRDVQALRGLAVLAVVLYHAGVPFAPGGFVGVDVFFVLSGYLITRLLVEERVSTGRIDLPAFLARRARRLLPAALVMIVVVALGALWIYPPLERDGLLGAGRAASLYVANLWFALQAVDYLGGHAAANPMLHMWSLGVEEQFYLLWPVALLAAAARWPAPGPHAKLVRFTVAAGGASFVACLWLTSRSQPWAFFGMPVRAWEFALGAFVWLSAARWRRLPAAAAEGLVAGGLAAVLAAVLLLDDRTLFPGAWALLPAGGSALVLAGLERRPGGRLQRALEVGWLVRVGDVSYSWYLWHWPLLAMVATGSGQAGPGLRVAAVALSWVLGAASFRFIEQPWRRGRVLAWPARRMLALALVATLGVALLLTLLRAHDRSRPPTDAQARYAAARLDVPTVYTRGCHADFDATRVIECVGGNPAGARTVVLFGDSHAAHWYPALDRWSRQQAYRLVSITKSGCPAARVAVENAVLRRPYGECDRWRADALRQIAVLQPVAVVLASSNRYGVSPAAWETGTHATLDALSASGVRALVLLRDTPTPGFDVPVCLARAAHRGQDPAEVCSFDFGATRASGEAIAAAERRAVADVPASRAADLAASVCPRPRCAVEVDGQVRFSDASHLSATFSASLAGAIGAALEPALAR